MVFQQQISRSICQILRTFTNWKTTIVPYNSSICSEFNVWHSASVQSSNFHCIRHQTSSTAWQWVSWQVVPFLCNASILTENKIFPDTSLFIYVFSCHITYCDILHSMVNFFHSHPVKFGAPSLCTISIRYVPIPIYQKHIYLIHLQTRQHFLLLEAETNPASKIIYHSKVRVNPVQRNTRKWRYSSTLP